MRTQKKRFDFFPDVNAETQLTLLRRVVDGFLSAVLVYFIYSYMHGIVKINNNEEGRESTIDDSCVLLISFLQKVLIGVAYPFELFFVAFSLVLVGFGKRKTIRMPFHGLSLICSLQI